MKFVCFCTSGAKRIIKLLYQHEGTAYNGLTLKSARTTWPSNFAPEEQSRTLEGAKTPDHVLQLSCGGEFLAPPPPQPLQYDILIVTLV